MLYSNHFFFPKQTFLQLFLTDVSTHDVILRMIVGGCFFIFGLMLCKNLAKRNHAEEQLHDAYGALCLTNDNLEKKVKERTTEMNNLLTQKNDLILGLSHDLKTPLTPLMGLLPMVAQDEKDPKLKELLMLSIKHVHILRDLVSKTIDLALLDSTVLGFTIEKTHLLSEVNTVLEDRQYLLKEHEILVENIVDGNLFIAADKLRLREVLNNLLTNSIKYTPKKEGVIIIDAKEKNDMVTISIKDSGIGLTPEQLTHIFDELYKADQSRHDHASVGLGLSICKRIVEKHGGTIWAESAGAGKGTTVFFTVPILLKKETVTKKKPVDILILP